MKKFITFALTSILTLGAVSPAIAANGNGNENGNYDGYYNPYDNSSNGYDDDHYYGQYDPYDYGYYDDYSYDDDDTQALLPVSKIGYITDYSENQLTVQNPVNIDEIIVLNLSESTIIVDAYTGEPSSIADRRSDRVKVYHAPFMTMSIPPQSPALIIALDLPENQFSPMYHTIEEIDELYYDTIRITTDNGGLFITLDQDTPLTPHMTRQMVELEHLQVGDRLLVWYEIIATSFPAQTTATRVIFLGSAPEEDKPSYGTDYEQDYDYSEYYDTAPPARMLAVPGSGIMRGGMEFFPVRALATEAGFDVSWEAATSSAVLTHNATKLTLSNHSAMFYINDMSFILSAAVFIENGVMYAPAELFEIL